MVVLNVYTLYSSWSISTKVWDLAMIKLKTLGSSVRHGLVLSRLDLQSGTAWYFLEIIIFLESTRPCLTEDPRFGFIFTLMQYISRMSIMFSTNLINKFPWTWMDNLMQPARCLLGVYCTYDNYKHLIHMTLVNKGTSTKMSKLWVILAKNSLVHDHTASNYFYPLKLVKSYEPIGRSRMNPVQCISIKRTWFIQKVEYCFIVVIMWGVFESESTMSDVLLLWVFLVVPWVGLQNVIVLFPDHTHVSKQWQRK